MGLALKNGHPIRPFWIVTTLWEMLAGTSHMLSILRCFMSLCLGIRGRFHKKTTLSLLVILSMKQTMVAKVSSDLKCISRLKISRETGPRGRFPPTDL